MHPASLLSYYPNYALLDEFCSKSNCSQLNIFLDLKNNLQTTFMEHTILNLLETTKRSNFLDSSIFSSILPFLAFHKIYAVKRNMPIFFYVFFETGQSNYHANISKKYKISRRIDDLYGLDKTDRDLFTTIFQTNLNMIETFCNRMPNIKVIRLRNLEADFVPYYLISRNLIPCKERTANLIYSNDHDMFQCLNDKTFVFTKKMNKQKKILQKGEGMKEFLKDETKIPDEYIPLALSIIGDVGDDVYGIKGIGGKTFLKIFDELTTFSGDMNEIYKNVSSNQPIFKETTSDQNLNKYTGLVLQKEKDEKIVSTNLRLTSFELISRALDEPPTTEFLEKRKHIEKILEPNEILKKELLMENFVKVGIDLDYDWLETIYFKIEESITC